MPKNRSRRRNTRRRKRTAVRDARGRRLAAQNELVMAFVEDEGLGPREERIARVALPKPGRYHTSHWLSGGIEQAVSRVGCSPFEAIELLERMQRWAHRTERVPQRDVAFQLVGLELRRRQAGGEPRTIALPEPLRPLEHPLRELRGMVAQWEAMSYACAATEEADSDFDVKYRVAATLVLVCHLARADGVPVRLDRLEPSEWLAELMEGIPDLGPPPEGYATFHLGHAATLYDRLARLGVVAPDVAARIGSELTSLSMAMAGPSHAA